MIRKISLVCLLLLVSACSPADPTPVDSGIAGLVTIGPVCPVMQQGMDCADQPYQGSFTVLTPKGREVTRFEADASGIFKIALPPGDYILRPESPNILPFAAEQPFTVLSGQFTQLNVSYDSGIR
jgi:hypothetical protein